MCFCFFLNRCRDIKVLRLKGIGATIDDTVLKTLMCCPDLQVLDISGGEVTSAGLFHLSLFCTKLTELYLSGCKRVTNEGITAIAQRNGSTLRLLDMQGCSMVGDEAATSLARHCKEALEVVSFQCCPRLTQAGFLVVCISCHGLRHLTLKHCQVAEEHVEMLPDDIKEKLTIRLVKSGERL